jgi:hypothetical protein
MKNAISIGFYSYKYPHLDGAVFKQFYDEALIILAGLGLTPTFFAADGHGHKGEAVPIDGRSHKRSMSIGFDKASLVSLLCNPAGSDAPAYDCFAEISLSFLEHSMETMLSLSVEEGLLGSGLSSLEPVLAKLVAMRDWDFGYLVSYRDSSNPPFYVLGADDGKLSKIEMDELLLWYNSEPAIRRSKVRNVHPINFLNEAQLIAIANNGQTLQSMIEADGGSVLKKVSDKLWRWDVPMTSISRLRSKLMGTGLTICGG